MVGMWKYFISSFAKKKQIEMVLITNERRDEGFFLYRRDLN